MGRAIYARFMGRQARIDAPGALHHIIVREIARKKVFDDNEDRNSFVERLITDTKTQCFAWALIPRSGFKTSPRAQSFRLLRNWAKEFNPRNITYIPAVELLGPP